MRIDNKKKALITARMNDEAVELIKPFLQIRKDGYGAGKGVLSEEEMIEKTTSIDVLIVELEPVSRKVIEASPQIKVIGSCRGTPNNVDITVATERGIPVLYTPGRNAVSVAEVTICLMLSLARNIKPAMLSLSAGNWGAGDDSPFVKFRGIEVFGKTLGIVGFGAIGQEVARRATALSMKVLVFDPYVPIETIKVFNGTPASLNTLLELSDFISLHAKLTDQSRGIIGLEEFSRMKNTAYLINTASGLLVDEAALLNALRKKEIAGAGLDVFSIEPLPSNHPLLGFDNVIALPHIGGATSDVTYHQSMIMAEDLRRFLQGERPRNVINPVTLENKYKI